MISGLLKALLGDRAWLVLLAVGAAGAWMYVELRQARTAAADLTAWAEVVCAASGSAFVAEGDPKAGTRCRHQVAGLADFKARTDQLTAETLRRALEEQGARARRDTQAALAAAQAAHDAATRMEAADAEAERRNLVDDQWYAAVNGVAGLRAPSRPAAAARP